MNQKFLLLPFLFVYFLFATPASESSVVTDRLKATYDAATGNCAGAPRVPCDQALLSLKRNTSTPSNNPQTCRKEENFFGTTTKTALKTTSTITMLAATKNALPIQKLVPDTKPSWVVSAVWDSSEQHLLMVDVKSGSILRFDLSGHLDQRIEFKSGDRPAFIHKIKAGGYIVKDANARVSWLGEDLNAKAELDLRDGSRDKTLLDSVWGWAPVSGNIFLFGDVKTKFQHKKGKEDWAWNSALLRTRPGQAACVEPVHTMDINDPARNFYLLGYPLLAAANNKGYALVMSRKPYILEAGFGARRLAAFPPVPGRPNLPESIVPGNLVSTYGIIERSKTVIGLISWKNSLFALSRQPTSANTTQWQLWEIDPARDKVSDKPIILPTNASHIVLVPGDRHWAIIEKGPVQGPQVQSINSIAIFPPSTLFNNHPAVAKNEPKNSTSRELFVPTISQNWVLPGLTGRQLIREVQRGNAP